MSDYTRGLHDVGDGLYAYLQPDGGWGWSNAGLITADGASLLVDTLFDLRLTQQMLDSMAPITDDHPLQAAVNTHSNGAHSLVPGHGPVTDTGGARDVMRYFEYVRAEARKRFDAGMDAEAAADDIDLGEFADWGDPERIAVNVV